MEIKKTLILDSSEPVSKALPHLDEFPAVIITKNGKYYGIIDHRSVSSAIKDPNNTKCETVVVRPPTMLEPATAHVVQDSIGTRCPVLDVTNACNSFMNALEIADSFIKAGRYQRILITTGEVSTKSAKLTIENKEDFKKSFPGYTFGDIGTAVLVEKSKDPTLGILDMCFTADSTHWSDAMLAGGGSRFRNEGDLYFQGSGNELKLAFESIGPKFIKDFLERNHLKIEEIKHVFIHQVSVPYLHSFMDTCGLTENQVEETVSTCGNVAAGSLPLAWSLRADRGELKSGDAVLMVGLAGGISLGAVLLII